MVFMPKTVIGSNLVLFVPRATNYHFGILTSKMHMAWVRQVCGRLSRTIATPPDSSTTISPGLNRRTKSNARALKRPRKPCWTRSGHLEKGQTLADLYDPLAMPAGLFKAHRALDAAVDRCYRREPFRTERQRVEFLFALYAKLTAPLLAAEPIKRRRRNGT